MGLSSTDLHRIVDTWLKEILEADEIERRHGLKGFEKAFWEVSRDEEDNIIDKGYSDTVLQEIDEAFISNNFAPSSYDPETREATGVYRLKEYVDNVIQQQNLSLESSSPEYLALMREMAKGYKLFLQAGQLRSIGNYHDADKLIQERLNLFAQANAGTAASYASNNTGNPVEEDYDINGSTISLGRFIEEFEKDKATSVNKKDSKSVVADLLLFKEYVGDIPLHQISVLKAKEFRARLCKLPTNWRKSKYKDMTFEEASSLEISSDERIDPMTAYKRLGMIRTALNWASKQGFKINSKLPEIVCGEKPVKAVSIQDRRDPFNVNDIKRMFQHEGYTEDTFDYPFQFWLPLLALYTGARQSELCQLNPQTDILQTEAGIWYLDINSDNGKRVKTTSGIRKVPIHQLLIDIGFIRFAVAQKGLGQTMLFPELKNERQDNALNAKASRWFNDKFKKEVGITSVARKTARNQEKKDFHSFRHHFVNYCKTHDVEMSKCQECIGHESDTGVTGIYSGDFGPDILYRDVISKLNFVEEYGLNFSHLHKSKHTKD